MSTFFRSLIDKRSALVYIDDILLLADEKQELAPEKSFYLNPIPSKIEAIKIIPSPKEKKDVMQI